MSQSDSSLTVDLYVRSLAVGDGSARIEETLSRLEDLESEGAIDDYAVHVWGEGVSLDPRIAETEAGSFIREHVAAFREWARDTGRTLTGFREHTTNSAMTGRVHRNLRVPAMALCKRRDDEIEWVAPCDDDGETTTVADRLAAIEEDADPSSGRRLTAPADD
jgi:hypothetical protein